MKHPVSKASILISLVGLVIILFKHYQIGSGFQYDTEYYGFQVFSLLKYTLIGLASLILSIASIIKKEVKHLCVISMLLALLTIILPLTDIWVIFIG
jgi:hypothetical protein